jgi:hypothetical protein
VGRIVHTRSTAMQAPARSGEAVVRHCQPSSCCGEQHAERVRASVLHGVLDDHTARHLALGFISRIARRAAGRAILVVLRGPNAYSVMYKTGMGSRAEGVCGYSRCSTSQCVRRIRLSPRHWSAPRRTAHAARNMDKEPAGSVSGEAAATSAEAIDGAACYQRGHR